VFPDNSSVHFSAARLFHYWLPSVIAVRFVHLFDHLVFEFTYSIICKLCLDDCINYEKREAEIFMKRNTTPDQKNSTPASVQDPDPGSH
jgi:hypothetical protein